MRIVFLGTPEFAVATLNALIEHEGCEVVAVVCQPDRPKGRGNRIQEPPIKTLARLHNIAVFQPERLSRSSQTVEEMSKLKPDLIVMVAFGQILKKEVLELPKQGVINVHASLLPAYRGAAPINWAIINGETTTGVTTMYTEEGLDTGPMLLKKETDIGPDMTSAELSNELSMLGANLLIETLKQLTDGRLNPQPQDDSKATYAPLLTKELGIIDWKNKASVIHNLVRGLQPWPGTSSTFRGNVLKILKTRLPDGVKISGTVSGAIMYTAGRVLVSCGPFGDETLELIDVQPANRSKLSATDWANGVRVGAREAFGPSDVN